jgi:ribosomal protein S18 acetylase RimI-like enzyme
MDLEIRPAQPQDVAQVVPLVHDSSRALLDATFGGCGGGQDEVMAFLRRDFLRGQGLFGYRSMLVAVTPDGRIVGAMTAYQGARYRRLGAATLLSVACHFGPLRFAAVARRMAVTGRLFIPPKPDSVFLANLCVAPGYRSRGYGRVLLEEAWRTARERGAQQVEFDVSSSNVRAQRLYERLGWIVVAERWPCCPRRGDGFRRMERSTAAV